eukprot:3441807-Alexandrium_andersonii.AAC.1
MDKTALGEFEAFANSVFAQCWAGLRSGGAAETEGKFPEKMLLPAVGACFVRIHRATQNQKYCKDAAARRE